MGGGHKFYYPKWVWTPSGGWWPNPVHWKRNTVLYAIAVAGISFYLYDHAEKKTVSLHLSSLVDV